MDITALHRVKISRPHERKPRMAKRTVVEVTDDIDGTPADQTIEFGIDGIAYTIDLHMENAGKFREALAPFLGNARRVGRLVVKGPDVFRAAGSSKPRQSRDQLQAIRDWANANGYTVSDRGRIPVDVMTKFDEAHNTNTDAGPVSTPKAPPAEFMPAEPVKVKAVKSVRKAPAATVKAEETPVPDPDIRPARKPAKRAVKTVKV